MKGSYVLCAFNFPLNNIYISELIIDPYREE